jgi:hypothetical protein
MPAILRWHLSLLTPSPVPESSGVRGSYRGRFGLRETTITAPYRRRLEAAVELHRLFPGISDNDKARDCARTIAGWQPLPPLPLKRSRACRTRSSTP